MMAWLLRALPLELHDRLLHTLQRLAVDEL